MSQLLVDFDFSGSQSFENFYAGPNQLVKDAVVQWCDAQGDPFLFLSAPSGFGKTHLLQACCFYLSQNEVPCFYLSLSEDGLSCDVLDGLDAFQFVCIDDVHCVAGDRAWEEQLFHLYNRIKGCGHFLLVVANDSPRNISWGLKDLASRLCWGLVLRLVELDDVDKVKAVQCKALSRGLSLPDNIVQFLLQRYLRDSKSLFGALDVLDEAALVEKRALTVPFVKEVLGG